MKRRAILELVCRMRKLRDINRKDAQRAEKERNSEYSQAKPFAFRAGMEIYEKNSAGMADAFHESAHMSMYLLKR